MKGTEYSGTVDNIEDLGGLCPGVRDSHKHLSAIQRIGADGNFV